MSFHLTADSARPDDSPDALRARIAALETRLADLEALLRHFPGVIARFDRRLRHRFVSASIERVTGLPAERFLDQTNRDLAMPAELVTSWDTALAEVFATGQPTRIQFAFPAAAGIQHYDAELVPELGPDGMVATVLAVTRDVTERVCAEAVTAAREAVLRSFFESAPFQLGVVELDAEGLTFVLVNSAFAEALGRHPDDLAGRSARSLTPDVNVSPTWYIQACAAVDAGRPVRTELTEARAGQPRTFAATFAPIMDPAAARPSCCIIIEDVTPKRELERALCASEQRYRALVEHSLDGIALIDPEGRLLQLNPALVQMLGGTQEQLAAMTLMDLAGRDVGADGALPALGHSGEPQATFGEWQLRRADGGLLVVEYALQPLGSGLTLLTVHDLTRRRGLELALRASAERLELILQHLPITFFAQDIDLRYTWLANPQLGLTSERVLGKTDAEVLPEASAAPLTALKQAVLRHGRGMHTEQCVRLDEQEAIYDLTIEPLRGPDGVVSGVLGVALDITARAQLEEELRRHQVLLQGLFDHAPAVILVKDRAGRYVMVNRRLTSILAVAPEHILGKTVHDLFPPEVAATMAAHDQQVFASGQPLVLEEELPIDGVPHTQLAVLFPVYDAQGAWSALGLIATDITERKQMEAALRAQEAALAAEQAARLAAEAASERTARLQAVTAGLAGALTREAIIALITDNFAVMTGAISGTIAQLDSLAEQLEIIGWIGRGSEEQDRLRTLPLRAAAPAPVAARTRKPVWLASREEAEARFPGISPLMEHLGAYALATLPLLVGEHVLGTMSFSYPAPSPFTPEDRTFLSILVQQCAQALERARLYAEVLASQEQLRHLSQRLVAAQEEERRHLARELHDEVGQELTGLRLALELASRLPPEQRDTHLTEAHRTTQELIVRVRALSLDLRPAILDDAGLLPALLWLIRRLRERTGILVTFHHQGLERRLPPAVETVAYRVVQEALTNIARHAGVDTAIVNVLASLNQLLVQVQDTGRGFVRPIGLKGLRSSGLAGMQERVEILGGTLSVETEPGGGTWVTVGLPLGEEPGP